MKTFARLLAFLVLLTLSSAAAWADSRHHRHAHSRLHFGIAIGSPWGPWGPWYSPPPFYYPPPYYAPIIVERQPPVYIERTTPPVVAPPQVQEAQQYWYYCASAKGYYPYVKECPTGWQQVLPQPQ